MSVMSAKLNTFKICNILYRIFINSTMKSAVLIIIHFLCAQLINRSNRKHAASNISQPQRKTLTTQLNIATHSGSHMVIELCDTNFTRLLSENRQLLTNISDRLHNRSNTDRPSDSKSGMYL